MERFFIGVIPGFMIQGGCPNGNGMGGPGYSIKGEFAQNGFSNDLKHTEGVLSMARAMHPNSAGSQFFIMHKDAPHLGRGLRGLWKGDGGNGHSGQNCPDTHGLQRPPAKGAADQDCNRGDIWNRVPGA